MAVTRRRQQRGYKRISALLDAASQVFAEQGYDQATMTEIAARASSSIGSLYQFFPSKEQLSDALIERYLESIESRFDELRDNAEAMSLVELVDSLVSFSLEMSSQYPSMVGLIMNDTRRSREATRRMRDRMRDILLRKSNKLSVERAEAMGDATLLILRVVGQVRSLPGRTPNPGRELALALRHYLERELSALDGD